MIGRPHDALGFLAQTEREQTALEASAARALVRVQANGKGEKLEINEAPLAQSATVVSHSCVEAKLVATHDVDEGGLNRPSALDGEHLRHQRSGQAAQGSWVSYTSGHIRGKALALTVRAAKATDGRSATTADAERTQATHDEAQPVLTTLPQRRQLAQHHPPRALATERLPTRASPERGPQVAEQDVKPDLAQVVECRRLVQDRRACARETKR